MKMGEIWLCSFLKNIKANLSSKKSMNGLEKNKINGRRNKNNLVNLVVVLVKNKTNKVKIKVRNKVKTKMVKDKTKDRVMEVNKIAQTVMALVMEMVHHHMDHMVKIHLKMEILLTLGQWIKSLIILKIIKVNILTNT